MNKLKTTHAFTLLEMLLVIAMIAILAGIVIVAINPGRQLAQARNTQRASDLRAIHSAVNQYYIDNKEWPSDLETYTTLTEICDTGTATKPHTIDCDTDDLIDLSSLVPTYISEIPTDPQITASLPFINTAHAQTTNGAGYEMLLDASSQSLVLIAPKSEEYSLDLVAIGLSLLPVQVAWACGDPLVDERDGQSYATVEIGEQCWMQENMNIGDPVRSNIGMSDDGIIEKYCYGYTSTGGDPNAGCDETVDGYRYGGLYQWDEAMQWDYNLPAQGICPTGWHIPTDGEWTTLVEGQATVGCDIGTTWQCDPAGQRLKANITGYNGTNESGFTALLSGNHYYGATFYVRESLTTYWSSSVFNSANVWRRNLSFDYIEVFRGPGGKSEGFSVRCLKDN